MPTLLAGDFVVCRVTAAEVNVGFPAVWASSDPNIVASRGFGVFVGKSEGQATLTATYSGQSVSAPVTVHLQDVFRITSAPYQGTFNVGTTATVLLQGFYGVASADSGNLSLVLTDQNGSTITTSAMTVPHGGDRYIISNTFTIRTGTTRVCRTGVLRIGSTTLTAVPDTSLVPCFAVLP